MASLISWLKFAGARTNTGAVVASGLAYFYVPGSSSVQVDIWQDAEGTVDLLQPVTLNAAGQAEVWTSAACDIVIKDALGVTVSFVASEGFGGNSVAAEQVEVVSDYFVGNHGVDYDVGLPLPLATAIDRIGASIGVDGQYKESGTTGVVARDVHDVLAGLCITPYDFGANGGGTADDTLSVQRAIDRAGALGVPCYLGAGIFRITAGLTVSAECHIIGAGKGKSVIRSTSSAFDMLTIATAAGRRTGERFAWSLRDFSIEAPTGTNAGTYGINLNLDTELLSSSGGTIERVDVTATNGIYVGSTNVSISNCNIIFQSGTSEGVGIETASGGSVTSCIVDGVAFSAANVSTGIKLGFNSVAERCLIMNCTVGGENKPACTGSVFRSCEMSACGHSLYVRASRSGAEQCDSTSETVADWKADASLTGIVSRNNAWDVPVTVLAADVTSTTDGNYSDVTGLTLNLVANVTYDIELMLAFTAGGTQGIKVGSTGGTATFATASKPRILFQTSGTPGIADAEYTVGGPTPLDAAGPTAGFATVRYVVTCATAGTFFPQVAQSAAGATAAVIKATSWARVTVL